MYTTLWYCDYTEKLRFVTNAFFLEVTPQLGKKLQKNAEQEVTKVSTVL
jgi:hypothetical protein